MGGVPGPDGGDERVTVTKAELLALREENAQLRGLLGLDDRTTKAPTQAWTPTLFTAGQATPPRATVDQSSPPAMKVALFRALFAGRDDVYAQRWDNERTGKGGWGPASSRSSCTATWARRPAPPSSTSSPPHPEGGGLVLAATASLLGEGFDCPPLDTLFLAFPIKFKGSVVQYVGRVLRPADTKTRVEVHDYVDTLVPVLARMHDERRTAYATLGFDLPKPQRPAPRPRTIPNSTNKTSGPDEPF